MAGLLEHPKQGGWGYPEALHPLPCVRQEHDIHPAQSTQVPLGALHFLPGFAFRRSRRDSHDPHPEHFPNTTNGPITIQTHRASAG